MNYSNQYNLGLNPSSYGQRYMINEPNTTYSMINPQPSPYGYPQQQQQSFPQNLLSNPAITNALYSAGGAALGQTIAGPFGAAIGGAAPPIIKSLITPQQEPWGQVLTQSAAGGLGGGLGGKFLGPIGAGAGAGAGGYFGYQLSQGGNPFNRGTNVQNFNGQCVNGQCFNGYPIYQ